MDIWEKLYQEALSVQNEREISSFVYGGQVAAALVTKKGNIYVGVCVEPLCGLAICAERNAIYNMITHGEHEISKIVAVMSDGNVGAPCGSCRELMMQLHKDSKKIQILMDYQNKRVVTLEELMPEWWGKDKY